ncbi:hypothetical protein ASG67_11765 [Sphingomonas sp. Leaf339]|nr:hypothetical protein ASG67_11765 [Sphingomonas sp. Leaf339]
MVPAFQMQINPLSGEVVEGVKALIAAHLSQGQRKLATAVHRERIQGVIDVAGYFMPCGFPKALLWHR